MCEAAFLFSMLFFDNMAETKSVLILNHFPFPYAIARYSNELKSTMQENSELVNVKINPGFDHFPAGTTYEGTGSLTANVVLKNIVFRRLRQHIHSVINGGGIVHYTDQSMPLFSRGGDREIVTFHDLFALKENNGVKGILYKQYIMEFLKFKNAIAISEHTRGQLEEAGFSGEISTIYHGIPEIFHPRTNNVEIRRKYGLPIDKKLIISVSSSAPRKNIQLLRKIKQNLWDDMEIVRVGPSEGFDLSFEKVSDETLAELYSAADLFILTSTDEGFNHPVTEAMASGLPVVVSDIEIMREVTGNAGIFCDVKDEFSFIEGIKSSLEERERYSKLSLTQAKKFTKEKFSKNMKSYYNKILSI